MNFTYDPMEFAILMDMNMNENSIYSNMVSGRDPPPLCMPLPTGPLPLGMDMCIKMFNIFTPGNNLHMCMDMMARIQMSPIIVSIPEEFISMRMQARNSRRELLSI